MKRTLPSMLRPLALSLALIGAGVAVAQAQPTPLAGAQFAAQHRHGFHGPRGDFGGHFARGLDLTEAQRDKLFELRHQQAPALRNHMKELRTARKELRELAMSDKYDEKRAQALSERAAKAQAAIALLNAQRSNAFYNVLTPEQRQKFEQMRKQRSERRQGGFGPRGRHNHGPRAEMPSA